MALYGLHDEYRTGRYSEKHRHATEPKKVLEGCIDIPDKVQRLHCDDV